MSALAERIGQQLSVEIDPAVRAFAAEVARAEPDALAVLFYGSNLRTGSLEGVLDFYVLTDGPQRERIWPRVSYREWTFEGPKKTAQLRAKIATMSLAKFREAASGQSRDTTIWARFVQPSGLAWHIGEPEARMVVDSIALAARTAARTAAALGPDSGTAEDYWRALFRATYRAEFRVEKAGREDSILSVNAAHFAGLLPLALEAEGIVSNREGDRLAPQIPAPQRAKIRRWWDSRRRFGKPLNVARLLKASTTFDGAARYAAWKIERHTGVPVELSRWKEKHPVLAAPGVLWKVWRNRR